MSGIGWYENIKIDVYDLDGKLVDTTEFHNKLTEISLNWMADALRKSPPQDCEIKYMGWGSSNLAVSSSHTALSAERGRKIITVQSSSGIGKCFTVCYLGPTEATTDIEELAWFAGSAAIASANTGCMISRVLYSRVKTALESITITRTDTFADV